MSADYRTARTWLRLSPCGTAIESLANSKKFRIGTFTTPSIHDLAEATSHSKLHP